MYGLSSYEDRVVATLPPYLRAVAQDAASDPESRSELRAILHSPNPAATLHREVQAATRAALVEAGVRPSGVGSYYDPYLDANMGGLFSRVKKKVSRVVKKVKNVHEKVMDKVLPQKVADFMKRSRKKISDVHKRLKAKHKKVFLKYGNVILPVVGAVLAPFTGGASLAAAAVLTTALTVYKQKEAARAALKAGKAEAKAMAAEVARQEAELNAQADALYSQYPDVFAAFGLTPDRWGALSVEQKLEIIDALSKGELPEGYSLISEKEAAAAGAAGAQAGGGAAPRPPVAVAPAPTTSAAPYPYAPAPSYPYEYGSPAQPQEGAPDQNPIVILVNGVEVASAASEEDARRLAVSSSSPGDRVDIIVNGQMTGLKLRTSGGLVDVPPDAEERVRSMSQEDARGLASRAAASASEGGGGGKFSMWWLLALPAAFIAAKAA